MFGFDFVFIVSPLKKAKMFFFYKLQSKGVLSFRSQGHVRKKSRFSSVTCRKTPQALSPRLTPLAKATTRTKKQRPGSQQFNPRVTQSNSLFYPNSSCNFGKQTSLVLVFPIKRKKRTRVLAKLPKSKRDMQ